MKYLLILISILIVLPSFGQRNKKKEDEQIVTPVFSEGITYALPRTGIRVYVTVENESVMAGPFNGYASQLLGIKNAPSRNLSKWDIVKVKISTFSEPNPDRIFKAFGEGAFLVNLTADGRLAGINSDIPESNPAQLVTNEFIHQPEQNDGFSFDNFTDTPFYIEGDSTNNYQPMRVSDSQKAAQAAKRILESRMNQYDMVAGMLDEFHPDGEAYKTSLAELKQIEKNYLTLFVGRTTHKTEHFVFDFIPEKTSGKGTVLFRISDEKGVVPANDLSGKPVLIEFEAESNLAKKYTELAKSENPNAGESGVYYQMPGMANIKITYELQTIASARAVVAQFGEIAPVPEEMLYGEYALEIHPETGAIKSVQKK